MLSVAVLQEPLFNGMGFLLFLAGIPIYWAGNWCKTRPGVNSVMGKTFSSFNWVLCYETKVKRLDIIILVSPQSLTVNKVFL